MLKNTFKCPVNLYSSGETGDKHCANCNKSVIDLRTKSNIEITAIAKEKGEFCGIIQSTRLHNAPISFAALAASILSFSSILTPASKVNAQPSIDQNQVQADSSRILKGIVTDKETKEAVPFVHIWVKQGKRDISSGTTDFYGKFEIVILLDSIDIQQPISVYLSTVGYSSVEKIITSKSLSELHNITLDFGLENQIVGMLMYELRPKMDPIGETNFSREDIRRMPRN